LRVRPLSSVTYLLRHRTPNTGYKPLTSIHLGLIPLMQVRKTPTPQKRGQSDTDNS
jgi:hypothetical protein